MPKYDFKGKDYPMWRCKIEDSKKSHQKKIISPLTSSGGMGENWFAYVENNPVNWVDP